MPRPIIMICEDYDGKPLAHYEGDLVTVNPIVRDNASQEERRVAVENNLRVLYGRDDLVFCWATRKEWEAFYQGIEHD